MNDLNWSYSGLKTAVLYSLHKELGNYNNKQSKNIYKLEDNSKNLSNTVINDMSASFQKAAIDSLMIKVIKAVDIYKPKMFIIGGGVIANKTLRDVIKTTVELKGPNVYYPDPMWLCTDNAAMIAIAAKYYAERDTYVTDFDNLDRIPNLQIN